MNPQTHTDTHYLSFSLSNPLFLSVYIFVSALELSVPAFQGLKRPHAIDVGDTRTESPHKSATYPVTPFKIKIKIRFLNFPV
jgi:hypothetical protein